MTTKEQILLMKKDINNLDEKLDRLDGKMDKIFSKLLDPEIGLVVRVNKNTERLDERDKKMPEWMGEIDQFRYMKKWKGNVTRALWVIYAAIIGYVTKLIFWN
jgi:tetrahydromethanopterin S-methyltransferase subunit G